MTTMILVLLRKNGDGIGRHFVKLVGLVDVTEQDASTARYFRYKDRYKYAPARPE